MGGIATCHHFVRIILVHIIYLLSMDDMFGKYLGNEQSCGEMVLC